MDPPLLSVRNLSVSYHTPSGPLRAVEDVSLEIGPGETLGLAGETGCGKSTVALAVLGLLEGGSIEGGRILFEGQSLEEATERTWRHLRGGRIGFVFQDARGSLNPVLTVGQHFEEALRAHGRMTRKQWRGRASRLLAEVGIPEPAYILRRYAHELSGGTCQRVGIALAICNRPSLLIADEPTSALDPTIQAQVIALLVHMKQSLGLALLFITHDLPLINRAADRLAVMYGARIVEYGPVRDVLSVPAHPYTRGLLQCVADLDRTVGGRRLEPIPGSPVVALRLPQGCSFAPRCRLAEDRCLSEIPEAVPVGGTHWAACIKAR